MSYITLNDYKVVGSGAYGKVYVGTHNTNKLATKRRYIVNSNSVPSGCIHLNEIDIMCRMRHPNILHAITMQKENPISDSFRSDSKDPRGEDRGVTYRADLVYLITNAADGDLSTFSISDNATILDTESKDKLRDYMWQIFSAIACLHSNGYIHRDIKPSNILYTVHDDKVHITLCDFDMCLPMISQLLSVKAMTPEYTPPEVLIQGADVMYTDKVDIWGAGLVMYDLVKGDTLIKRNGRSGQDLDDYILAFHHTHLPGGDTLDITNKEYEIDTDCNLDLGDKEVNDLLHHMLECDVDKRWSILQCMRHPLFQGREVPQEIVSHLSLIDDHDAIFFDHIINTHYITEEMAKVFDSYLDIISENEMYGFFLGLDILMRVCHRKYKGKERNLAVCCFNLGMKYFGKESARFSRIDNEDAKKIEYNIIANHLSGNIYRDTVYNHINSNPERIYTYLMSNKLFPNKLSTVVSAIRKVLDS